MGRAPSSPTQQLLGPGGPWECATKPALSLLGCCLCPGRARGHPGPGSLQGGRHSPDPVGTVPESSPCSRAVLGLTRLPEDKPTAESGQATVWLLGLLLASSGRGGGRMLSEGRQDGLAERAALHTAPWTAWWTRRSDRIGTRQGTNSQPLRLGLGSAPAAKRLRVRDCSHAP